jgi:hypothetical protein
MHPSLLEERWPAPPAAQRAARYDLMPSVCYVAERWTDSNLSGDDSSGAA